MADALVKHFSEIRKADQPLVGNKALNLALLRQLKFRVPNGFCVTTNAYRASLSPGDSPQDFITDFESHNLKVSVQLAEEILSAYHAIGGGKVAARSSATAEDLEGASFAGQQETFLNIEGDAKLLQAVEACWESLWTERAVAYREDRGIQPADLAMAVVVQQMVDAEVAGVLFTQDPTGTGDMVIESSWGLGEAIVSGLVTPDHFRLGRIEGAVQAQQIHEKTQRITSSGQSHVPRNLVRQASLDASQLKRLWRIGLDIEKAYEAPQDIEWAYAEDQFYVLQTRAITSIAKASESQLLVQEEIQALRPKTDPEGTVWSRYNLAEVLPAPLPMTWSIVRKFMSGRGGFGLTYRDLGFQPHSSVDEESVLDLIAGRIYFNLSREPRLYFNGYLMQHNFLQFRVDPQKAMYPRASVSFRQTDARFWLQAPRYLYQMVAADRRMKRLRKTFDHQLKAQILPEFLEYVQREKQRDLSQLSHPEMYGLLQERIQAVMDDFAREALKASVFAALSFANLEMLIGKCFGDEYQTLAKSLIVGLEGDLTVETNLSLWKVATGELGMDAFLFAYGHRAVNEFELAQPRWREDPQFVIEMVKQFRMHPDSSPIRRLDAQHSERQKAETTLAELPASKLAAGLRIQIQQELQYTQRYMPFRETAKFYLMLGYELIRDALLELGRRFSVQDGIFYLHQEELPALLEGQRFDEVIAARTWRRDQLLAIEVPDVLFSDNLEAIGQPPEIEDQDQLHGLGVSAGVASGPAVVLHDPSEARGLDAGYVLVCPSTDPGWTPLFLNASALVMERGGMLSHGAVVAREYGLPAVANISQAMLRIQEGQMVRVDGFRGVVTLNQEED